MHLHVSKQWKCFDYLCYKKSCRSKDERVLERDKWKTREVYSREKDKKEKRKKKGCIIVSMNYIAALYI